MDDVEDVHELPLVLVYSLDLDVVQRVEWDIVTGVLLDPGLQLGLVLPLDVDESVLEGLISGIWYKLLKVLEGGDPLIDTTKGITEQVGESWVAAMDPSSWCDTIGLVLELSFVELIELLEDGGLEQLGVQGCDSVDGVRAYN
mgnify:CR=1 FL=1